MKRIMKCIVALALAGCSGGNGDSVELRLRGANAGDVRALFVEIGTVAVEADGRALSLGPGQQGIDLAAVDHAWLVATYPRPPVGARVHVRIALDDFGGYEREADSGSVDARGAVLVFDVPSSNQPAGMVTALLDVAASLTPTAPFRLMLTPATLVE